MSGCARPPFAPPKANSGRLFAMAKQRRKLLLVDGYNVLRSGSRYRDMRNPGPNPDYDTDSFNRAREALIDDVVMYAGRDFEAIIVVRWG